MQTGADVLRQTMRPFPLHKAKPQVRQTDAKIADKFMHPENRGRGEGAPCLIDRFRSVTQRGLYPTFRGADQDSGEPESLLECRHDSPAVYQKMETCRAHGAGDRAIAFYRPLRAARP